MQTFGLPSTPLLQRALRLKACKNLIVMQKVPIKRELSKRVCSAEREERAAKLNNSLAEGWFIPNRSLGPISSGDVKVFSCSPESKECLPLIYGSHKT